MIFNMLSNTGTTRDILTLDSTISSINNKLRSSSIYRIKPNSTVIIDPPRSGAGKHVIERLLTLSPDHLIYVACDPIAVARDLAPLTAGGYKIASIKAFDLFPHTHHFETVVSLVR